MAYSVVCISATDGAMGEEIGPRVADGLGFRLVNEQIVAQAAEEAGVQAHVMAELEVRRSVVERVIHELLRPKPTRVAHGFTAPAATEPAPRGESLRSLIPSVIEDIARHGDAVIVSHAASHALHRADVLRVLMTAGAETRRDRVMAARDVSEREAEKLVARGDASRADYIKRFYGVSAESPTQYDIVLNSDRLSVGQAVEIIVRAASADPVSAAAGEAGAR